MNNLYWEKEEFEDLVTRGLIAMYETKLKKHKFANKAFRFTPDMMMRIRKLGCYFPVNDRLCMIDTINTESSKASAVQEIDIINDGRVDNAIICHKITKDDVRYPDDDMRENCYLEITYIEKISSLPAPVKCEQNGRSYRLINIWARDKLIEGVCQYVRIDHKRKIFGTYWIRESYDKITGKCSKERVDSKTVSEKDKLNSEDFSTFSASILIQYYQDRRHLWNVSANEGIAKATFSVYPEQIKSLFYSREIPMTETGRKRPILHWVNCHQRRMKNGIEIDIEKHLRGINEFLYNGTKFIITRPIKDKIKHGT